jgi:hypothetical protein
MQNPHAFANQAHPRSHENIHAGLGDMVSHKRKRNDAHDTPGKRAAMAPHSGNVEYTNGGGEPFATTSDSELAHQLQVASGNDPSTTAAAALAAEFGSQNNGMSFVSNGSNADLDRHLDSSFDLGQDGGPSQGSHGPVYSDFGQLNPVGSTAAQVNAARESANNNPKVGSEEWRKIRRDNHKEGGSGGRRCPGIGRRPRLPVSDER